MLYGVRYVARGAWYGTWRVVQVWCVMRGARGVQGVVGHRA